MIENIINILWLDEYENIRKIPKNIFYKEDDFSKSNEKLFTKDVNTIHIISALNKNSINISTYKTDDHNYSEIYYIYVSLKSNNRVWEIKNIIHSIIPNPCIIILWHSDSITISTATKRINKNDNTKQVIEDYFTTNKIDLIYSTKIEKEFLTDIVLINNSFENFKRFYLDFSNKVLIMKTSELRWWYKKTSLENIEILLKLNKYYKLLNQDIDTLNNKYNDEIAMWPKAILHSKIIAKEKELTDTKLQIKEI